MHTSVPRYVTRSRGDGRGVMFEGAVTRSRAGATPRPGRRDSSQGRKRTPAHFFKAITGRKPSPPLTGVQERKTLKAETSESGSASSESASQSDSAEDHDVTIDNVNNVRDFKTNSIDENLDENISHGSDDNKVSSVDSSDEIDTTPEQPSPTITNHGGFSFSTQGFPIFMAVPGMTPAVLGEVLTSAGALDPSTPRPTSPVPPYPTLEPPLWPLEDHQTTDLGDVNWVSLYGEWTGGGCDKEDLVDHGNDQAQGKSGKGNHYL